MILLPLVRLLSPTLPHLSKELRRRLRLKHRLKVGLLLRPQHPRHLRHLLRPLLPKTPPLPKHNKRGSRFCPATLPHRTSKTNTL